MGQAYDRLSGFGNKAFADANPIGAVCLNDADFLLAHKNLVLARILFNGKHSCAAVCSQRDCFIYVAVHVDDRIGL